MSTADTLSCIPSNPDISGIGVRTAIYAQNILSFAPAFFALRDKKVTETELDTLETQSTTILIIAFAILISTIVQALTGGTTNFHTTIILNLSWMNNTNLFIYFLLYVYHKAERAQEEPTQDRTLTDSLIGGIKAVLKNPVFVIGSLHLSLMAGVGIWLWIRPASFGDSLPCSMSTSVTILGYGVKLGSPRLRGWSILVYSLLGVPGLNLIVPVAFLAVPYLVFRRILSSSSQDIRVWSVRAGLIVLAIVDVVVVTDTEVMIRSNGALMEEGDTKWTFGQTLALLLLMVPIRDLAETLWERRPKSLGKKLLDAARKRDNGVIESFLELGADANVKGEKHI